MGIVRNIGSLCLVFLVMGLPSCRWEEATPLLSNVDEAASPVVRILTWKDYLSEEVSRDFTWETGIRVEKHEFSSGEEMVAQLRAYPHRFDLVVLESSSVSRLAKQRLLREIDSKRIPPVGELQPDVLNALSEEVKAYSIPYHWGTTVVAYRNDKIGKPEESFGVLFDPRWKKHAMLLDSPFECLGVMHLMNGRSINSYSEEDINTASDELHRIAEECDLRFGTVDAVKAALGDGSCWAALCYSGDCARLSEKNPQISFFAPREGAGMWLDVLALSRDVENVDEAYQFLSYLMRPACIAKSTEELKYPNPYPASWDNVDQELFENRVLWPGTEELKKYELFGPRPLSHFSLISRRFSEITRGRHYTGQERQDLSMNASQ